MAKVISQETYDDVIKENIVEFSMSVDESREETIKQFEAQGINLANIIKDLTINETTGLPVLNESINFIKDHVEQIKVLDPAELENQLDILISEISKSVPHRVTAAKYNTQDYLLTLIQAEIEKSDGSCQLENSVGGTTFLRKIKFLIHSRFIYLFQILHKLILCAHAMTNKNPDIFDDKTLTVVLR